MNTGTSWVGSVIDLFGYIYVAFSLMFILFLNWELGVLNWSWVEVVGMGMECCSFSRG